MYASVRRYAGVDARLFDELERHRSSLEATLRGVSGFRSWYSIRTDEGLTTVTLCEDRAGADASVRAAADWVRANIPDMISGAPEVANGEVVQQIGG
jgi:hypothetical protein